MVGRKQSFFLPPVVPGSGSGTPGSGSGSTEKFLTNYINNGGLPNVGVL